MPSLSLIRGLAPIQTLLLQCLEEQVPAVYRHGQRVGLGAIQVGARLGLSPEALEILELAAGLHDLGKLLVPSFLAHKTIAFNREEYQVMQRHALLGARLLESHAGTEVLAQVALHHHERWDGKGYPGRLSGEQIPPMAQITAVLDAYDAMTSDRYGGNHTQGEAASEILRCRGTQFSPVVVDAFMDAVSTDCLNLER